MGLFNITLRERIPLLVEPIKSLGLRARDFRDGSAEDLDLLVKLSGADLVLEMLNSRLSGDKTIGGTMNDYNELLEKLEEMSKRRPEVRVALKSYLPRLREFADQNSCLQDIYNSYENAFGGQEE